jgi:hypothetical protein
MLEFIATPVKCETISPQIHQAENMRGQTNLGPQSAHSFFESFWVRVPRGRTGWHRPSKYRQFHTRFTHGVKRALLIYLSSCADGGLQNAPLLCAFSGAAAKVLPFCSVDHSKFPLDRNRRTGEL